MTTQPFMPLFFGDFLAATAKWEGEERALYLLLLAYQWTSGPLPKDEKKICKMCGYDQKTFASLWETVGTKFVTTDDGLVNVRLEVHRDRSNEISTKRSQIGSAGGKASGEARRQAKLKQLVEKDSSKIEAIGSDLLVAKSNHPSHPILIEESKSGSAAQNLDPRKQLFDLGKSILGPTSGGLISKAISETDEETVGAILGSMALKPTADPRAYFSAAIKRKERGGIIA